MSDDVKRDKPVPATPDTGRRVFLQKSSALSGAALMAMLPAGVRNAAWAAGSDAPEKKEVKVGFIPLTDCASVVMASVLEFDKKYGIKITPTKEASWASVRDKLVNGDIDASHVLYGLIYGLHLGVSGPKKDMAVLMALNHNGQAITLSKKLADKGRRRRQITCRAHAEGQARIHLRADLSRPGRTRCGFTTGSRQTACIRSRT